MKVTRFRKCDAVDKAKLAVASSHPGINLIVESRMGNEALTWAGWTAVASVASALGAIGTVGALVVIYLQLKEMHQQGLDSTTRAEYDRQSGVTPTVWIQFLGPNLVTDRASDLSTDLCLNLVGDGRVAYLPRVRVAIDAGVSTNPLAIAFGLPTNSTDSIVGVEEQVYEFGKPIQAPDDRHISVVWTIPVNPVGGEVEFTFTTLLNRRMRWLQRISFQPNLMAPVLVGLPRLEVVK